MVRRKAPLGLVGIENGNTLGLHVWGSAKICACDGHTFPFLRGHPTCLYPNRILREDCCEWVLCPADSHIGCAPLEGTTFFLVVAQTGKLSVWLRPKVTNLDGHQKQGTWTPREMPLEVASPVWMAPGDVNHENQAFLCLDQASAQAARHNLGSSPKLILIADCVIGRFFVCLRVVIMNHRFFLSVSVVHPKKPEPTTVGQCRKHGMNARQTCSAGSPVGGKPQVRATALMHLRWLFGVVLVLEGGWQASKLETRPMRRGWWSTRGSPASLPVLLLLPEVKCGSTGDFAPRRFGTSLVLVHSMTSRISQHGYQHPCACLFFPRLDTLGLLAGDTSSLACHSLPPHKVPEHAQQVAWQMNADHQSCQCPYAPRAAVFTTILYRYMT